MGTSVGNKFGFPVHKMPKGSNKLAIPYAKVGVELECEQVRDLRDPQGLIALWQPVEDHSLRNRGMEFITRGTGLVGDQLVKAVIDLCTFTKEKQYDVGYPRAGIHLHLDMTDMNEESGTELLNCVLSYMLFEEAIFKFVGTWRKACGFCDPLSLAQHDFKAISQLLYGWEAGDAAHVHERRFSKYGAINFLPLARFGTIEFRQLPTTFDSARILNWINLCLCFKRFGKQVDCDPVELLEEKGCKALAEAVFGEYLPIIQEFIVEDEVYAAIADARSLRVGQRTKQLPVSWDAPDNPFLMSKKEAVKPVRKRKPKVADVPDVMEFLREGRVVNPADLQANLAIAGEAALYGGFFYNAPGSHNIIAMPPFEAFNWTNRHPLVNTAAPLNTYEERFGIGSYGTHLTSNPRQVALFLNEYFHQPEF